MPALNVLVWAGSLWIWKRLAALNGAGVRAARAAMRRKEAEDMVVGEERCRGGLILRS